MSRKRSWTCWPRHNRGAICWKPRSRIFEHGNPTKQTEAKNLQDNRDRELAHGQQLLGEKDIVGYAGMAGQFAIALASVAALTRRRPAFYAAVFFGLVAFGVTGYAMVMHYFFMKA